MNFVHPDPTVPELPSLLPLVPESCSVGNPSVGGGPAPAADSGSWGELRSSPLVKGWL